MNIMCILTGGFEGLEAADTVALPRRTGIRINVYAINHTTVAGRFDITISSLADVKDVNTIDYDMLFLPGGPYYQKLEIDEHTLPILKGFVDQGELVSTIYAAPVILGRWDYLRGRKYTCFTSMNEDLGETHADQYVIIGGTIIAGRGAAAVIDLVFAIVEKLEGREKAEEVKAPIYY